ncbi:trichohyalin-like isoform X2 [Nymphalis io]|uniref:trichohyalin-like isoform X2 n=1 Tax=Inachis io TaxID=171585 RepID=UPI0021679FFD|nr:trichohyalin-like isoform X2 [Nymphalis io]
MPIVMTKDEWSRIERWAEGNREEQEVARRRDYVRYLNETSQEMTKNWPNSLENVNKRNEELRRARIEAAERANSKFYKRYVKRKQEEQERLLHNARDTIFKNKDAPKLLLGAVIETVIQKERQEQIKFKQEIQKQKQEQKKRDDDEIISKAKEWHELMALRSKRRFDANKQHQKEILDQAHEVSERNRIEYESELNLQKIDNMKAEEQMDAIRQFEMDFKAAEKARILSDMQRSKQEAEQRQREKQARDELDRRLLEVLARARARTHRRRRLTEQQIQDERQQVLQKISESLESGDAAREAEEQRKLEAAVREKEAAAEARREADIRKQKQFKQQRIETRQQFLKEQEKCLQDFNTMRQWEIMNRFKNAELYEDFKEKLRVEKALKVQQYREDIIKQWHERDERSAHARAELRHFYGPRAEHELRVADRRLLAHARALADEARAHGRPARPLLRALDVRTHSVTYRYCKMYRLYAMPDLPASMQEHFPHYEPEDRRDGLGHGKASSSKELGNEKGTEDYKRNGPANGLQARQTEVSLPSLAQRA